MDKQKWDMCGKKKSFHTRRAANKCANKHDQRVYECPHCFCFHLTSKEKIK